MTEVDPSNKRQLEQIGKALKDGHERLVQRRRRVRNRVLIGAASVLVLGAVAAGASTTLTGGGSDPTEPAVAQVLERAAKAAEAFPVERLEPGQYAYELKKDQYVAKDRPQPGGPLFTYQTEFDTERWVASDRSGLSMITGAQGPTFATPQALESWNAAGRPRLLFDLLRYFPEPFEYKIAVGGAIPPDISRFAETKASAKDLLDVYDISRKQLIAATSNQGRFNGLVYRKIKRVTIALRPRAKDESDREDARSDARSATFSLALELLSDPRIKADATLTSALLRLAAYASGDHGPKINVNAKDRLGRPAIAITFPSGTGFMFDPESYVITQSMTGSVPASADGKTHIRTETYSYGVVDAPGKRPDGSIATPIKDRPQPSSAG